LSGEPIGVRRIPRYGERGLRDDRPGIKGDPDRKIGAIAVCVNEVEGIAAGGLRRSNRNAARIGGDADRDELLIECRLKGSCGAANGDDLLLSRIELQCARGKAERTRRRLRENDPENECVNRAR